MPYCANCGAKLEGMETFCSYCGEAIESSPKASESSTDSQIETLKNEVSSLRQQLQDRHKPVISRQKKQDSSCLVWCCVIFFIVLLLGFLPWIIVFW